MRTARTVSSASTGRRQEVEIDRRRLLRIGRHDVDVPPALRPHRMCVTGHAGLAGDARSPGARLGQHRHPAQQQVGRLQPFARADEGADRRGDHAEQPAPGERVAQGLTDHAEAAAAVVEGERPSCRSPIVCAARNGRAGSRRRPAAHGAPRCRARAAAPAGRGPTVPAIAVSSPIRRSPRPRARHALHGRRRRPSSGRRCTACRRAAAPRSGHRSRCGDCGGCGPDRGSSAPCSSADARRSSPGSWRCRPAVHRCSRDCAGCRPDPRPRSTPRTADRASRDW